MKRFCGFYTLVAVFLPWMLPLSVQAQSLRTFDRQVCQGASIYLDGGLYQIQTSDCEIQSIKADGMGEDLKDRERIELTATTNYHITYVDNTHPGGTVAYARITVLDPPVLKVEVVDPRPVPGSFCKGASVSLQATRHNEEVYWTISSDEKYSEKGTSVTFELEENCRITAQSYNTCGFVDTSIYFSVVSEPDLSNARLVLNTELNGTFCTGCGFFPKADEIVVGATQGTIKESSIAWEDGSSEEEPIQAGPVYKKLKVHAVIERENAGCGASATATRVIDSIITLTIPGGMDCRPTLQAAVNLKPCRDGEVQLRNPNKGLCAIQGNPTLEASPAHPKIVIGEKTPFPYQEPGRDIYRWNVRWENYSRTDAQPSLVARVAYAIACPYSKKKPSIPDVFEQKVNVVIDTAYISFKYEYCPDGNAALEIKGQENIVTIKDVVLIKPTGGFSSLFNTTETLNHSWTCVSVDAVTTALLEKYSEIRLKVTFEVKDGTCRFTTEREEVVRLKQRNDCTMEFDWAPVSSYCIGVPRGFRLVNAGDDVIADSVVVDPHPVFTFKRSPDNMSIEPYYAGAAVIDNQTDNITATIYYHMKGSGQPISMTKEFELNVISCKPEFKGKKVEINNNEDKPGCPMCPGAVFTGTVSFTNPRTVQDSCVVEFISTSDARADSKRNRWNGGLPQFVIYQYLFGDMDYNVRITYNEGDSVYTIDRFNVVSNAGITLGGMKNVGEEATNTSIKMADICALKTSIAPGDSVCSGEWLDLYVYSENLFEELQTIEWEDKNIKPAAGTDAAGREDWEYTFQYGANLGTTGKKIIKRFHYQVRAEDLGVYAFKLQSKIRESIFERRDTLRVAVLKNPRIFIQDTVYACLNARVDLWKYVDSTAVDVATLKCPSKDGLIIEHAADDYRVATADLRYHCSKSSLSERIDVKVAPSVYNAFIADTAHCPGEQVALSAKTNGRVTWTRRRMLEGGGFSQADTLVVDGENKVIFDEMGKEDQLYTVTARTGCDQPPFSSVQFRVVAKKEPSVSIIDNSACRPEPLFLQTEPFPVTEVDSARDVVWYVDGKPYTLPSVPPSESVMVFCVVKGLNGCYGSDTLEMKSYEAPDLKVDIDGMPEFTGNFLCVDNGDQVSFTARGADAYDWFVASRNSSVSTASVYTLRVNRDDTVYVAGTEQTLGCRTTDTLFVYLKPTARVQEDAIACLGESFSIPVVPETEVSYSWYDQAGNYICSCSSLGITGYVESDTGLYTVRFTRKGCEEERKVQLRMYPVPRFDFSGHEFCEDDRLSLDVNTGLEISWLRQGRFIWKKDGVELQDSVGQTAYEGPALALSDSGIYHLQVSIDRCSYIDSIHVRVDAHSHPAFAVDSFYCEGTTFRTEAEDQGDGATYLWYSSNRVNTGEPDPSRVFEFEVMMEDDTMLTLEVHRGACVDDTSIFVHVRSMPRPEIFPSGSRTDEKGVYYCEGMPMSLEVADVRDGDLVHWYRDGELMDGSASGRYTIVSAALEDGGGYQFEVERNGCYGRDSLYVEVRIRPVPLVNDTFMCAGHALSLDAFDISYPEAEFRWMPSGTTGAMVEINAGGSYSVVMSYEGCDGEKSFIVEERPSPQIGFPLDTVMCQRDSILLSGPEGMEDYLWQDGSTGRTYLVKEEGFYTLFVELMGCSDYSEVSVHEDFCSNLYFPSAFTPNGDGINDRFAPITTAIDEQVVYSLYIYNRNGEKVFESHSLSESWDGTCKGVGCPAGVYVYRCKAHAKQNGRNLSTEGTVSLLR